MEEHVNIKRAKHLPEGLDFDALRLKGIAYLQESCGAIWTDYNEHDPGVTLLEHLCYALTDLAYRAGFDIKDVLYANEEQGGNNVENGFFPPVDILPTTPITPTDYRRILIDRIRDIRNAWFYPIENHPRGYKGLFRIRIQLADDIDRSAHRAQVVNDVRALIMEHRNLCEDLDEADIIVLKTEYLDLKGTISIEADAFGEKVLANLIFTLEQTLNPGIRFYSHEELIAEGRSVEEIFDGPEPFHGFIKKEDLRPLPESTHSSRLREVIAKVPGVKLVGNLVVRKDGQRIVDDEIIPGPDSALSLDPTLADISGKDGTIRFLRNGVPVSINPRQTRQYLNTLSAKAKKGFQLKLDLSPPPVVSRKNSKELASYRSFQRLMPAIYGIGAHGLPATANRKRRAQAYQLKAYLLLFEQFMADYLVQLANTRKLFSIAPDSGPDGAHPTTYFTQFPADIPNVQELYYHGLSDDAPLSEINAAIGKDLQQLSANFDPSDKRRNRFLDHLLARFGEVYNDDFLQLLTNDSREVLARKLIEGKAAFIRNYPKLSINRGKAFNYTKAAWCNENVSGLKKRISLLLNINGFSGDDQQASRKKYHNRPLSKTEAQKGLNLTKTSATPLQLPFKAMLNKGRHTGNYDIVEGAETFELHFKDKGADAGAGEAKGQGKVLFTGSMEQCFAARDRMIARILKINDEGEGFFFLENILLRPVRQPGNLLLLEVSLPNNGNSKPPPDSDNKVRLRSLFFTDEETLNELSNELLVITTRETNWAVLELGEKWHIILLKNDAPVLISTAFDKEATAKEAKDQLIKRCIEIRDRDPLSLNNYLRLETERFDGHKPNSSFYSLRLSIIAPAWPALFQENDFRQLFQHIVASNIPAHLSVDYYWLEPAEMTKFEDLFQKWLQARCDGTSEKSEAATDEPGIPYNGDPDTLQQLSLELIRMLRPEELSRETPDAKHDETHQKLPAGTLEQLGKTYGYTFFFADTDFSIIQGLSPEAGLALPEAGIPNLTALQAADPVEIVNELEKLGQLYPLQEVKIWQRQATLVHKNRWTDLLRYQRRLLTNDTNSAPAEEKPTKFAQALQEALRQPAVVFPGIRRWVSQLNNDQIVPYPILRFLIETAGYGIILPDNDLLIFSCIDDSQQRALNKEYVRNWQQLSAINSSTWKSVLNKTGTEDSAPELPELLREVNLALTANWQELISLQRGGSIPGAETAIEQRITHHLSELMAPAGPEGRLLVTRLRSWPIPDGSLKASGPTIRQLLEIMRPQDFLSDENFRIFTGVGPKSEAALKAAGILNWQQLAAASTDRLRSLLSQPPAATEIEKWTTQAKFAQDGQWEALTEWQKGPVPPATDPETGLTSLETGIRSWLKNNAAPAPIPPA